MERDPLLLILERLDQMDQRLTGIEQRVEEMYQELDRDIINLHTDLTNFRTETADNFRRVHQDIKWLTGKWVEHDKAIAQLESSLESVEPKG